MTFTALRQRLSEVLDCCSQKLEIENNFSHYSRSKLVLIIKTNRKQIEQFEEQNMLLSRKIIRMLDDVEIIASCDLSIEVNKSCELFGAVGDALELLVGNYTKSVEFR